MFVNGGGGFFFFILVLFLCFLLFFLENIAWFSRGAYDFAEVHDLVLRAIGSAVIVGGDVSVCAEKIGGAVGSVAFAVAAFFAGFEAVIDLVRIVLCPLIDCLAVARILLE